MTHLEDADFVDAYYGNCDSDRRSHLETCAECGAKYQILRELLDACSEYPVPARSGEYGAEVWARVAPHLPLARPRAFWQRTWILAPAAAALVALVFVAGLLTERHRAQPFSVESRERVLLMAMSAHLDRSQILLAELLHAKPGDSDLGAQQARARDLVNENRLLRERAARMGDRLDASVLGELEPVLIELANSPPALDAAGLSALQKRVEHGGILFKVRVSDADTRNKGQRL